MIALFIPFGSLLPHPNFPPQILWTHVLFSWFSVIKVSVFFSYQVWTKMCCGSAQMARVFWIHCSCWVGGSGLYIIHVVRSACPRCPQRAVISLWLSDICCFHWSCWYCFCMDARYQKTLPNALFTRHRKLSNQTEKIIGMCGSAVWDVKYGCKSR